MFDSIKIFNLLYLDIETAGIEKHYYDMSDEYKEAWEYHCHRNKLVVDRTPVAYEAAWQDNCALLPEFSKIICISMGKYVHEGDNYEFKTQTFHLNDGMPHEETLLVKVAQYIDSQSNLTLIAHAGKDFDYPFMIRRFLANNMLPPDCLHILNKKPWEVKLLDTKEIWKFGGYRSASLASICAVFNIPSPKSDMSGADTHLYFWDGKYENIAKYCSNDVRALARITQSMCLAGRPAHEYVEINYVK